MIRVLALLSCVCLPVWAADRAALEAQKIEYLIGSIAGLTDAKFIRNDTAYDAAAAAAHLRLKLRTAGSRVKTAVDFISYCASVSSMSGRPYLIRFSDGSEVTAAAYLRAQLKDYESRRGRASESQAPAAPAPSNPRSADSARRRSAAASNERHDQR
jgi:hypothetical protein